MSFLRRYRLPQFSLALTLTLVFGAASAEPQGGRVVGGAGTIHEGKDTVVEQSSRDLVVDWKRFDVGKNESVHFRQESAGHSVLNRIYDSKPSEIWGRITARGRVWLLNPNGVFFGRGARVSVGSLVASGLWMEKEDFLAGRYVLSRRGETAGTVRNAGVLEASSGGIGLAGGSAVNEGEIRARAGRVTLAGGERMVVDFDGDGLLGFTLAEGSADSAVRNEGTLEGGSVSLGLRQASGVFDGVVNNEGVVRALGIEERGGVAVLVGSEVNHTGRIAAQGGSQEGHGPADASQADTSQAGVSQAGSADSVATIGGTVELQGARISHGGAIEVSGATGGTALLEARDTLEVSGSTLARGETGAGGDIRLLAERVNVRAGAQADASGATDGGAVRVGGGWQGLERGIRNAWETMVERGVSLRADGGVGGEGRGDGGTVVVWSDGTTRFVGRISARGGALGGNGGRAEVSGREHLYMRGLADLRAPQGRAGTLLLDPGRVDLCHEGATGCDMTATPADDTDGPDRFSDMQLATMLGTASVTIQTSAATTRTTPPEAAFEDIVASSDFALSWTTANTLTLEAGRDILLDGSIDGGTTGILALNFGRNLDFGGASLAAASVSATGAAGTQTITGPSGGSTWAVTANGAGTLTAGTQSVSFSNVENLQGGSMVDTFTVSGAHTGDLLGGGGADVFNIGETLTGSLSGEGGADTFNLNTGGSVSGGITGAGGADTFDFNGGSVMGTVAGGADADILDFADLATAVTVTLSGTPVTDGFDGATTGAATVNSFAGIQSLVGGMGTDDILSGLASGTWTLAASDRYESGGQTLSFSDIENLQGGTGVDTFTVSSAHTGDLSGGGDADVFTLTEMLTGDLSGGGGADTFDLDAGGSVTGTVAGGADADILDFAGLAAAVTVTLSGTPGTDGFDGATTGAATVNSFTGIRSLVGGMGTDILSGLASAGTWTLDTSDSYASGGQTLSFSDIEDLQGGTGVDTFTVSMAHTGDLSGGGDADVFTLTETLTGDLSGGGGADTFDLDAGGSVTGTVAGGADADILDLAGLAAAVTVTLSGTPGTDGFDGATTGAATVNSFTGIRSLVGGMGTDILSGLASAGTWTLDTSDRYASGGETLSFSDIEDLQGGSMVDTFTVSDVHTGDLSGGGDADIFTLEAALTGSLMGEGGADTFNLNTGGSVSGSIQGGADGDIFNLNAAYTSTLEGGGGADAFNLNEVLTGAANGEAGEDTFTLGASGSASGGLDGGADTDTLEGRDADAAWTLATGNYASGTLMQSFSNIENLQGGTMADTFTVSVVHTGDLLGGGGADAFNLEAVLTGAANGEAGEDTFTLGASGSASGGLDGGADTDTLEGRDADAAWTLATGNYASGSLTQSFSNIENLQGGTGVDTFTVSGAHTGDLLGGGGADAFNLDAALTGAANGEAGDDTFTLGASGSASGGLDGGADTDTLEGRDAVATWTLSGTAFTYQAEVGGMLTAVTLPTLTSIETLQGGTMADTFSVAADYTGDLQNLRGGVGNDLFNVDGTIQADLSGGSGADMFTLNAVLTGAANGEAGDDTFTLGMSGSASGGLDGGADTDTLTGRDADATWVLDPGGNRYVIAGVGLMQMFSNIEELQGGSMADTFDFDDADAAVTANGGRGADILDFATLSLALTASLDDTTLGALMGSTRVLDGFQGSVAVAGGATPSFTSINAIHAGSATTDTLQGLAGNARANDDFFIGRVSASYAGRGSDDPPNTVVGDTSLDFSGFESLVERNTGHDTEFTFSAIDSDVAVVGDGMGLTTLALSSLLDTPMPNPVPAVTVTLSDARSAGYTGSVTGGGGTLAFRGITSVNARNRDRLQGRNVAATWVLTGARRGRYESADSMPPATTRTLVIRGFDAAWAGGTGTDTFQGQDARSSWDVSSTGFTYQAEVGGVLVPVTLPTLTSIEALRGGSDVDTFMVSGDIPYSLSGGDGAADVLDFAALTTTAVTFALSGLPDADGFDGEAMVGTATVAFADIGDLRGGTSTTMDDSLTGLNAASTWTLGATADSYASDDAGGTSQTLSFSNIEVLTGGTMADTLQGRNADATWTLATGGNRYVSGTLTQSFSGIEALTGGTMADTFDFDGGTVTGAVSGGTGTAVDVLDFATLTTAVLVSLSGTPDADGFAGNVVGGATVSAFSDIGEIRGSMMASSDELAGLGMGGSFTRAMNRPTAYTFGGQTLALSNFENTFDNAAALLNLASMSGDLIVTLTAGAAGGYTVNWQVGPAGSVTMETGITEIRGGMGTNDRLTGLNEDASWALGSTPPPSYTVASGAPALSIRNIENLQGGSGEDTFFVSTAYTGNLMGGGGDDSFEIRDSLTGTASGGAGDDTFTMLVLGSVSGGLDGGTDTDTLMYEPAVGVPVTWTLAGTGNTYASGVLRQSFQNIENLQGGVEADTFTVGVAHTGDLSGGGGADVFTLTETLTGDLTGGGGADTFDLDAGGSVTGTVAGGADADILDFAGLAAAVTVTLSGTPGTDGFDGATTGAATVNSFTGIRSLVGGMGTDSLSGLASGTWTLAASDSYESGGQTLSFSDIEDLQGGTGVDTFTVSSAHTGDLSGGGGADVFTLTETLTGDLTGGGGADTFDLDAGGSVTGTVAGGADADILDFAGLAAAVTVTLSGTPGTDGFDGATTGAATVNSFTGIRSLVGGMGTDILSGLASAGTWTLDTSDSYASGGQTLSFSAIENLQGGSMADTFEVSGAHTGDLLGGGGADAFNLNEALTGAANGEAGEDTFTLGASGSASGGLDGGAETDTLEGRNADATWTLASGSDSYVVAGLGALTQSFSNIEDLQGGSMADTFEVSGAHTGDLLGGDGADAFNLNAALTGAANGEAGADTFTLGASGSASGGLDGGAETDTLEGRNADATWTLASGSDSYVVAGLGALTQSFSNIEDLQGGSMADTFEVSGAHTGDLLGGGGADAFNLNAALTGAANGEAGEDTFTLGASGSASVGLDGGADTDTLEGRDADATWTLATGNYASGSLVQSFSNIEDLQGGSMVDTFTVSSAHTGDLLGGGGADAFNLNAALTGAANGEAGADTFTLGASGSVMGTVAGGADADILDFAGLATAVAVTLSGTPDADGFGGSVSGGATVSAFTGIGELRGGTAVTDSLAGLNADSTWTLDVADSYASDDAGDISRTLSFSNIEVLTGGTGVDTFTVSGAHTGSLSGGMGTDVLDFTGLTAAVTVTLSGTPDADGFGGSVSGGATVSAFAGIGELRGGTAMTDSLAGLDEAATWTVGTADRYESGGQALDFSAIENLQGGTMADTFTVSGMHVGSLSGGSGTAEDTLELAPAAGWAALLLTPTMQRIYSGDDVMLSDVFVETLDGFEAFAAGPDANVYVAALPDTQGTDLAINPPMGRMAAAGEQLLTLPDLRGFQRPVLLGGIPRVAQMGAPDDAVGLPLPVSESGSILPGLPRPEVAIDERGIGAGRLTIAGPVAVPGSLALLGQDVALVADVAAGATSPGDSDAQVASSGQEVVIVAAGTRGDIDVSLGPGETIRNVRGSGALIVAGGAVEQAVRLRIYLGTMGPLRFAQGGGRGAPTVNPASVFRGVSLSVVENNYIGPRGLNLNVVEQVLSVFNPASDLLTLITLFIIDPALFETELELFSLIGTGISMYLSQCEELDGCAPPLELSDLEGLIADVQEILAGLREEFRRAQAEEPGAVESRALDKQLRGYEKVLQDYLKLREEFIEYFGGGDEDFDEDFDEDGLEEDFDPDLEDEAPLPEARRGSQLQALLVPARAPLTH